MEKCSARLSTRSCTWVEAISSMHLKSSLWLWINHLTINSGQPKNPLSSPLQSQVSVKSLHYIYIISINIPPHLSSEWSAWCICFYLWQCTIFFFFNTSFQLEFGKQITSICILISPSMIKRQRRVYFMSFFNL